MTDDPTDQPDKPDKPKKAKREKYTGYSDRCKTRDNYLPKKVTPPPPPDRVPVGLVKHDDAVRIVARRLTNVALSTLSYVCERGLNESARIAAAKEILDRGWGKTYILQSQASKPAAQISVVFGEPPQQGVTIDAEASDDAGEDDC